MFLIKVHDPSLAEPDAFDYDKNLVRIGRHDDNDLIIQSPEVSKHHATLHIDSGGAVLTDHESANGTYHWQGDEWLRVSQTAAVGIPGKLKIGPYVLEVERDSKSDPVESCEVGDSYVDTIGSLGESRCILVLDLFQSAEKAYRDEQMAFHLKKRLFDIAKRVLDQYRVEMVKNTGDGLLATSDDPERTVLAAESLMRAIERRNAKTKNPPIEVRIAIHQGKTYTIDPVTHDIHGNDVNITFRMDGMREEHLVDAQETLPEKDRVLCSGAFVESLPSKAREDRSFVFCGHASLKGIGDPLPIHLLTEWTRKLKTGS